MNKYRVMTTSGRIALTADDFTINGSPRVLAFQKSAPTEDDPEGVEIVAMFQCWDYFVRVEDQ